jgi:hypothetical protein
VKVEPHLGNLKNISGEMPHPAGKISVQYTVDAGTTQAAIILPPRTNGRFIWKGKSHILKEGKNSLRL